MIESPADRPPDDADAPITAKVDPETLVLRGRPARVVRFRRGAIVALAGGTAIMLVATTWFALRPTSLHLVASGDDQVIAAKAPADAIGELPGSYDAVPQLGPPLPGDLGRPILEHQRSMATEGAQPQSNAEQSAATERERIAAERKAARESGLLAKSAEAERPVELASPASAVPAGAEQPPLNTEGDPNGQMRKNDFLNGSRQVDSVSTHRVTPPASPNLLSAGSVIAASLITGLRSDLPGFVTAQVTERVFDSATGQRLLIPQGARLIGTYDSVIAFGQRRALVVWQRLILPDGASITLENVPATDGAGYAGLADKVDFHTWTLLKGVAMSTLLGVGANLTFTGESDLVQAIRESTQQNVARAGDQITSRNLSVQPTITIRPGAPVRLLVHRDIVLPAWTE